MEQLMSSLGGGGGDPRGSEDGLANFGNKVKEYWNTVKTEPPQHEQVGAQVGAQGEGRLRDSGSSYWYSPYDYIYSPIH